MYTLSHFVHSKKVKKGLNLWLRYFKVPVNRMSQKNRFCVWLIAQYTSGKNCVCGLLNNIPKDMTISGPFTIEEKLFPEAMKIRELCDSSNRRLQNFSLPWHQETEYKWPIPIYQYWSFWTILWWFKTPPNSINQNQVELSVDEGGLFFWPFLK